MLGKPIELKELTDAIFSIGEMRPQLSHGSSLTLSLLLSYISLTEVVLCCSALYHGMDQARFIKGAMPNVSSTYVPQNQKEPPVLVAIKLTRYTGFEWNEQVNETVSQVE
jgi:hypothetical protein